MDSNRYWILVENRKWKFLPWPRVQSTLVKECTFDEVRTFVDDLRKTYANDPYQYKIRVGVERGIKIVVVH